jgi:hypothetical protein
MRVVTVKMNHQEKELLDSYAKLNHLSISEAIKKVVFEKLEDDFDAKTVDKAYAEFTKDPVVISGKEMKSKIKN